MATGTGSTTPSCPGARVAASCSAPSARATRTRTGRVRVLRRPGRAPSAPTWSPTTWTRCTSGPRRPAPRSSPNRTTPTTARTTSPPPTRRGTAGLSGPTGASPGRTSRTPRGNVPGMRAWHVEAPGPVTGHPLRLHTEDEVPRPGPGELLLRVLACGVCRTDLHVTEGDLPPHRPGVTPGHEVVGEVAAVGDGDTAGFRPGDRAGAAWLRWTDNTCTFCRRDAENLCPSSLYTGWDADGGYVEYMTVPAAYAHRLPPGYTNEELAPLLCAGIIGYRALQRAELPDNGRLGIYGFGGSAH